MYRSLSIRKLDAKTYEKLQRRANKHGVSMEEEARQILKTAVESPERLGDFFVKHFGPQGGVDLVLPAREPYEPAVIDSE